MSETGLIEDVTTEGPPGPGGGGFGLGGVADPGGPSFIPEVEYGPSGPGGPPMVAGGTDYPRRYRT